MAWSQKFRLTPVIHPSTLLQNILFCLFLLTSVVQNVCVCTMDFVSAGKNTSLLHVTVCEKVVPELNKHDDIIEWNFMKIALPRNEELVAPLVTLTLTMDFSNLWKHCYKFLHACFRNRRQKVFNRGALRFCGGDFRLCGGAWHFKN